MQCHENLKRLQNALSVKRFYGVGINTIKIYYLIQIICNKRFFLIFLYKCHRIKTEQPQLHYKLPSVMATRSGKYILIFSLSMIRVVVSIPVWLAKGETTLFYIDLEQKVKIKFCKTV